MSRAVGTAISAVSAERYLYTRTPVHVASHLKTTPNCAAVRPWRK